MHVHVDWTFIEGSHNPLWESTGVLYSYVHPHRDLVLYVGKAGDSTLKERQYSPHKNRLFEALEEHCGSPDLRVMRGDLHLGNGKRRSPELLADVEALLIRCLQPVGNINGRGTNRRRPDLKVICGGDWPLPEAMFLDP
jgi:hypothetical protein